MFNGAARALDVVRRSAALLSSWRPRRSARLPRRGGPVRRALQTGTGEEWRDEDADGVVRRDDIVNAPHEASRVERHARGGPAVEDRAPLYAADERVVLIDGDMMTMSWPSRHLRESRTSALRSESRQ